MKKRELPHSDFNGYVGMFPRRLILLELMEGRYKLETKWQKRFKKITHTLFVVGLVTLFMLGILAFRECQIWDTAEKVTISSIYHGDADQVEQNKKKAYKKIGK